MPEYWREFRTEWRAVSSATFGLAFGLVMTSYAVSIMGPHLIREFGWEKADLVKVQMITLVSVFAYPLVGRLADTITTRRTALIGVLASPVLLIGLSMVNDLTTYAVLFVTQSILLATTTPPVYSRIVVQRFNLARGLALAIAVAGPSLIAATCGPLLNNFVVDHGWRAGYVVLAVATLGGGGLAIMLMPPERRMPLPAKASPTAPSDYAQILRTPAFWLLNGAVLLCTMPMAVLLTQMGLIVGEHGVVDKTVSVIVSAYAGGMVVGRLASGIALDKLPAKLVASGILALSAVGLFIMSQQGVSVALLAVAVMTVGLSFGAESDMVGYLISRIFPIRNYGLVFGILSATTTIATAAGAATMAMLLDRHDSYAPFLTIASVSVLLGSLMFLMLPRPRTASDEPAGRVGGELKMDTGD
jgi:MFS family permease